MAPGQRKGSSKGSCSYPLGCISARKIAESCSTINATERPFGSLKTKDFPNPGMSKWLDLSGHYCTPVYGLPASQTYSTLVEFSTLSSSWAMLVLEADLASISGCCQIQKGQSGNTFQAQDRAWITRTFGQAVLAKTALKDILLSGKSLTYDCGMYEIPNRPLSGKPYLLGMHQYPFFEDMVGCPISESLTIGH